MSRNKGSGKKGGASAGMSLRTVHVQTEFLLIPVFFKYRHLSPWFKFVALNQLTDIVLACGFEFQ